MRSAPAVGQAMGRDRKPRRAARAGCVALVFLLGAMENAAAQSLIDALFGREQRSEAPRAEAPRAYAPQHGYTGRDQAGSVRPWASDPVRMSSRPAASTAYCVRLCDGRYFPLQRHGETSPADLCSAVCPASRTKVFMGSEIDSARAPDGTRYASLTTAFVYRARLVPDCTCNGQTSFGLAALDPATDPTLRPGDLVATKDGLMAFRGARRHGVAAFTPVDRSRLAREQLGAVTVAGR